MTMTTIKRKVVINLSIPRDLMNSVMEEMGRKLSPEEYILWELQWLESSFGKVQVESISEGDNASQKLQRRK